MSRSRSWQRRVLEDQHDRPPRSRAGACEDHRDPIGHEYSTIPRALIEPPRGRLQTHGSFQRVPRLDARVPVGQHLADQLLAPLALAGGGSFRTLAPSGHTRTDAQVVERFLDVLHEFE